MISNDPVSPIRPVGSDVTLTCTVELSPAVDVPVTVNTVLTGPYGFMTTNTAQPVMRRTTTYTTTAMVSSFGRDQSGVYTRAATVNSASSLVSSSMGSVSELLLVKPKSSCMCDAALCEEHCNSYCQDSACLAVSSGAVHMNTTS